MERGDGVVSAAMTTRELTFPVDVERFIAERLTAGEYASADELVAEAVRRLSDDCDIDAEVLRELVQESLNDPSPNMPAEDVWRMLDERRSGRRNP